MAKGTIVASALPRKSAIPCYLFVGVDPGFTGAVAFLEDVEGDEWATVYDMPVRKTTTGKSRLDRDKLVALIANRAEGMCVRAVVEATGAMGGKGRKEGASSMYRFGQGQGEVLGILAGLGATVFEVPPATWKVKAGLMHMDERAVCKRALKQVPWSHLELFGPRGGALHGRAEALFLAAYARMIVEGKDIYAR